MKTITNKELAIKMENLESRIDRQDKKFTRVTTEMWNEIKKVSSKVDKLVGTTDTFLKLYKKNGNGEKSKTKIFSDRLIITVSVIFSITLLLILCLFVYAGWNPEVISDIINAVK